MLEVENLKVQYGVKTVLDKINFKLPTNEVMAVLGPSGSGKTTLINAVTGLINHQGKILYNSRPLTVKNQTIALVPQDYGLLPWKTAKQNIELGLRIRTHHALTNKELKNIANLTAELGLTKVLTQFPSQLSGGQKQRVAIARAFSMRPDLLILDEPFSALDTVVKAKAQAMLMKILLQHPTTTLFITHSLQEALIFSDKLLVLTQGAAELLPNPLQEIAINKRENVASFYPALTKLRKEVNEKWQEN